MVIVFLILVVAASVGLGFIVLVQNPKGGGLAGNVGGIGNNFMGVKQTTDVLEKGTWIFASVIAVLAIVSTLFFKGIGGGVDKKAIETIPTNNTAPAPAPQTPANTVPAK